jgi:hypothetical protein
MVCIGILQISGKGNVSLTWSNLIHLLHEERKKPLELMRFKRLVSLFAGYKGQFSNSFFKDLQAIITFMEKISR